MRLSVGHVAGWSTMVAVLHTLTFSSCSGIEPTSATEMLRQNLCICPCGNPKGGKLYKVLSGDPHNWFEAVAHCSALGMSIVAIEDATQRELLRKHMVEGHYRNPSRFWIGANTLRPERGLLWGLTEREVRDPQWRIGDAPAFGPKEPICVMLDKDMKWIASDCASKQNRVICEY